MSSPTKSSQIHDSTIHDSTLSPYKHIRDHSHSRPSSRSSLRAHSPSLSLDDPGESVDAISRRLLQPTFRLTQILSGRAQSHLNDQAQHQAPASPIEFTGEYCAKQPSPIPTGITRKFKLQHGCFIISVILCAPFGCHTHEHQAAVQPRRPIVPSRP